MPSTAAMTNYLEDELVDHVLRNAAYASPAAVYVALYTSDPGEADAGVEVAGGAYTRIVVTFGAPADGVSINSVQVDFVTATALWGVITHFQIMDAAAAGNALFHGALENSVTINIGDTARFQVGDLQITLE